MPRKAMGKDQTAKVAPGSATISTPRRTQRAPPETRTLVQNIGQASITE